MTQYAKANFFALQNNLNTIEPKNAWNEWLNVIKGDPRFPNIFEYDIFVVYRIF